MPAQQQHTVTSAYLSGTTGAVAVGSCMVPNAAGTYYVVATAAARAAASRTTCIAGVAITAGDDTNRSVEIQTVGPCPQSITGLGDGAAGALVVGSDGRLIRQVEAEDADAVVVGKCDVDGFAYLNFPNSSRGAGGTGGGSNSTGAIYSLAEMSRSTQMVVANAAGDFTIGQLFYVTEDYMTLVGVKFYWGVANKSVKVSLWNASNVRLQTETVAITTPGIYVAYFTQPLTMGAAYRISCWQTDGANTCKSTTVSGVVMARPYFVNSGYVVQGSDRYAAGDAHPDSVSGTDIYLMDPLFAGAGSGPGPAAALDGLSARLARTADDAEPGIWDCEALNVDTAVMGGVAGTTYTVSLRIVGVAETKIYDGGTNDGAYWQIGGTPSTGLQGPNTYRLEISSPAQSYYLNRSAGASSVVTLDYQKDVQIDAGATVTLTAASVQEIDGQYRELAHTTSVSGIADPAQPYLGQWINIEIQAVSA